MTEHILDWLHNEAAPIIGEHSAVTEIGSLNVNGTARDVIPHRSWTGWDITDGPCVDRVSRFVATVRFDLVIACESLEHDPRFWETLDAMHDSVRSGGHMIITTPYIAFPYHSYGGDYYRFTTDTYIQVFFAGFTILDLRIVGNYPDETLCAIGQKP